MKKLILLLIIISFASCYTAKKAQKQIVRAHITFPEISVNFCENTFPTKDSVVEITKIIKGKDIVKYDTIKEIDCDSVVSDVDANNKILIRYKNIYRTDTITKEKLVYQENTAKTKNLVLENKRLENEIFSLKNQLKNETESRKKYRNYFFGLLILLGVYLIGKFKFGI